MAILYLILSIFADRIGASGDFAAAHRGRSAPAEGAQAGAVLFHYVKCVCLVVYVNMNVIME